MSKRLDPAWSRRAGRRAIMELQRIGRTKHIDPQVRVNALATILQCCGEDVDGGEVTRAIGFDAPRQDDGEE